MKRRKKRTVACSDEDFIALVKTSTSCAEVISKLGLAYHRNRYSAVKRRIYELKIDIGHFVRRHSSKGTTMTKEAILARLESSLTETSRSNGYSLKLKLLDVGIKFAKCERCLNTEWLGGPIPTELHHVNGIRTDNRIENLQILCPNCHTLTPNYGIKNKRLKLEQPPILSPSADSSFQQYALCPVCRKEFLPNRKTQKHCSQECSHESLRRVKRPSREELEILIESNSWVSLGRLFGVSDNAVRKWARKYGL